MNAPISNYDMHEQTYNNQTTQIKTEQSTFLTVKTDARRILQ